VRRAGGEGGRTGGAEAASLWAGGAPRGQPGHAARWVCSCCPVSRHVLRA